MFASRKQGENATQPKLSSHGPKINRLNDFWVRHLILFQRLNYSRIPMLP